MFNPIDAYEYIRQIKKRAKYSQQTVGIVRVCEICCCKLFELIQSTRNCDYHIKENHSTVKEAG